MSEETKTENHFETRFASCRFYGGIVIRLFIYLYIYSVLFVVDGSRAIRAGQKLKSYHATEVVKNCYCSDEVAWRSIEFRYIANREEPHERRMTYRLLSEQSRCLSPRSCSAFLLLMIGQQLFFPLQKPSWIVYFYAFSNGLCFQVRRALLRWALSDCPALVYETTRVRVACSPIIETDG